MSACVPACILQMFVLRLLNQVDMLLSEITSPLNGGTSVADDLAMLKGGLDQPDALSENLRLAVLYRYREKCVLAWLKKWASDFQAQFDAAAEDA